MIEGLIEARVRELHPADAVEQENAIQVARFVPAREQEALRAWSARFFAQLAAYLPER